MPSTAYDSLTKSFTDVGLPADLVEALLVEYQGNKRRYFLADYGPAAIDAGRFCEAVTRVLEYLARGAYTPLSEGIKVDQKLNRLDNDMRLADGLRLRVTRAIRLIYGVRNQRDHGHLRDGIDPTLQDRTLVVACLDWILAELVRFAHAVTPAEAQSLIEHIVTREVPIIEEIGGMPVLLTSLRRRDQVLALLYWSHGNWTEPQQLRAWLPPRIGTHLRDVLKVLIAEHLVHTSGTHVHLTRQGIRYVEEHDLLKPL